MDLTTGNATVTEVDSFYHFAIIQIEFTDDIIEERQHKIAEEHGYELVDHSLVLYVRKKTDG